MVQVNADRVWQRKKCQWGSEIGFLAVSFACCNKNITNSYHVYRIIHLAHAHRYRQHPGVALHNYNDNYNDNNEVLK